MKIATIKTGLTSLAMLPGLVMAAPAVADKADNAFMMICTALVLFMTIPGIALFYGCLLYTNPHPGICDVCQSALGGLFPS
ncbi:hypothetical protein R9U21_15485, partial [Escherichia coli]